MSGHVFRVVSGAPSRTLLTSLWLATAGHTAVFGQAKLRCSRCGLRVLGDSDVRSCGFELISQVRARGARRLVSAMACSRFLRSALGIPMLRSYVFELISQDSEHCTNRQGCLVACQGKPGWISVAQGFRPFGHVGFELISQVRARGARRLVSAMACSRFLRSGLGIPTLRSTCL